MLFCISDGNPRNAWLRLKGDHHYWYWLLVLSELLSTCKRVSVCERFMFKLKFSSVLLSKFIITPLNPYPVIRHLIFILQRAQSKISLHIYAVWSCSAPSTALSLISVIDAPSNFVEPFRNCLCNRQLLKSNRITFKRQNGKCYFFPTEFWCTIKSLNRKKCLVWAGIVVYHTRNIPDFVVHL